MIWALIGRESWWENWHDFQYIQYTIRNTFFIDNSAPQKLLGVIKVEEALNNMRSNIYHMLNSQYNLFMDFYDKYSKQSEERELSFKDKWNRKRTIITILIISFLFLWSRATVNPKDLLLILNSNKNEMPES